MKQVLLLADQPFQLNLMSALAKNLREKHVSVSIFLTDLFTFVYGPHLIENLVQDLGLDVITLESEFRSWQIRGEPDSSQTREARIRLLSFETLSSRGRNLTTLRLTDPYTNGFEFEDWYLPISKAWLDVAHADIISRCQRTFQDLQPDLIVSIDNCQLSTNIFHALAQDTCTFITFQNSRIGARWLPRFDFAIGDYRVSQQMMPKSISRELLPGEFDIFKQQVKQLHNGLYRSPAVEYGTRIRRRGLSSRQYFFKVVKEVKDILIHTPRSILLGPRSRNFKVRRFDQNFFRINIFEAKRRLANLLPDRSINPKQFRSSGYFFWTLHYRPEGSGLVLGLGRDEFGELINVANLLASQGELLVIKENPLMFGTRRRKDMKSLSELSNVIFAPRFSNPIDWIVNSKGVIGISGTSLLEAAILGVPAYALGFPEFLPSVWSQDEMSIEDFLINCINRDIPSKETSVDDYLKYVLKNSSDQDVLLNPTTGATELKDSIERMSEIIQKTLIEC